MKLTMEFTPATITLETRDEVVAARDAFFATNNEKLIAIAKELNKNYPAPRTKSAAGCSRKHHGKLIYEIVLEWFTNAAAADYDLMQVSLELPQLKRSSIASALTYLHQSGRLMRSGTRNKYTYRVA